MYYYIYYSNGGHATQRTGPIPGNEIGETMNTVYYLTSGKVVARAGNRTHVVPTFFAGMSGPDRKMPVFTTDMYQARQYESREAVYEEMARRGWDYFEHPYYASQTTFFEPYNECRM